MKIIILIFLSPLFLTFANGQIRYISGTKGVEANVGKAKYGQFVSLGASVIKGNSFKYYLKAMAGYEGGKYKGFKRSTSFLEFGGYSPIFKAGQTFYMNGFVGVVGVIDVLNGFEGISKKAYLTAGPTLGIEPEIYLSDNWVLLGNFKYRITIPGTYHTYYTAGLGLKYLL